MTAKTLLISAALTLLPGVALAMGCIYGQEKQAMSCAQGSSWDSDTQSCKPTVSG